MNSTDVSSAAGLVISTNDIVIAVLVFLVAVLGFGFFIRKNKAMESRRKHAIEIGAFCEQYGLVIGSGFFRDYSVGNYTGMFASIRTVLATIRDPEQRKTLLRGIWLSVTKEFFKDPYERDFMLREFQAQAKAHGLNLTEEPEEALGKAAKK